jgi:hypothetical protein
VAHLRQQRAQLEEVIEKAFQAFDKDGSGYIDAKELKKIAKEMGRELDAAEVDECMKDIDIDKDNRISYEEFNKWWLSGRQGLSPWMRRLLASKLTALKVIDQLSGPMLEILSDATHSDINDISTSSLSINLNNVGTEPGLALDARVLFLSPELHKEHIRLRTLHSFPQDANFIISLALALPTTTGMEGVLSLLPALSDYIKYMLPDPSLASLVVEGGHTLAIGLNLSVFLRLGSLLDRHSEIIKRMQSELKVDQNVELSVRLAASPEELLSPMGEPLITLLLKGIQVGVRLNVWKRLSDVLIKIIEKGEVDTRMMPLLGGLAPAFLMKLNAKLDLTVDDHMMSKIQENPLIESLLMDADSLIGATSSIGSDEELEEHLKNLKVPPAIGQFLHTLIEHLGDEVNFSVTHPQLGLQARLTAKSGLKLIVKSIAKYLPGGSA